MGSRYAFAFQGLCASRNWLLHGSHQAFDSTEKRPGDFRKKTCLCSLKHSMNVDNFHTLHHNFHIIPQRSEMAVVLIFRKLIACTDFGTPFEIYIMLV